MKLRISSLPPYPWRLFFVSSDFLYPFICLQIILNMGFREAKVPLIRKIMSCFSSLFWKQLVDAYFESLMCFICYISVFLNVDTFKNWLERGVLRRNSYCSLFHVYYFHRKKKRTWWCWTQSTSLHLPRFCSVGTHAHTKITQI